jgi:hypothetical protein
MKKNKSIDSTYPLIIFDHFEALPLALKHTEPGPNRELLKLIMHSIGQFSQSVSHDKNLSHVVFVGDESFMKEDGILKQYLFGFLRFPFFALF